MTDRSVILSQTVMAVTASSQRALIATIKARHGNGTALERLEEAKQHTRQMLAALELATAAVIGPRSEGGAA